MGVQFLTIAAGQTVSSAFALQRTERSLMLGISSHAGVAVGLQFASTLNGPFLALTLDPVTGTAVCSISAGRWLLFPVIPTAVGRIFSSSAMTATTSFTLIESPR